VLPDIRSIPCQIDTAGQHEKQAFLAQPGATGDADYLRATRRDPISPYEVKAGTVIPAVMIGGVNSDVPGMIVGQVAENVHDTATGRYLLIPQGPSSSAPMTTASRRGKPASW
jgi:type IV secretion system protein VirB10